LTTRVKAFIQFCIIIISTLTAFLITDESYFYHSVVMFLIIFFSSLAYLLKTINTQLLYEKNAYRLLISDEEMDVCIVVAIKNEGETIINTVNHYLSFPKKIRILLYDDGSTDQTLQELIQVAQKHPKRLEIRRLKKRDICVHPKAFALEEAFNEKEADLFLVIDADTIISQSDFKKALSAMKSEKLDVLHIARRNNHKDCLVNHLADREELMNMIFQLTHLNTHQFSGSGYFVRKSVVQGLVYSDGISSEDTYILEYVKKRRAKIRFFLSLFAQERAPKNYFHFIRQRRNWFNQSAPFYIKNFFFFITMVHILVAFAVAGLIVPISIGFFFVSLIISLLLAIEIAISVSVIKESVIKTFFETLLMVLNMAFVVWPVYLIVLFKIIFSRSVISIHKNH